MSTDPQTDRPEVDDPRVLALAKARQQMAHKNPFNVVCPPWDGLTEQEQQLSLLDARNYLRAAIDAGLTGAPAAVPPTDRADAATVKQRADLTETQWAEQERARFERLYTREYSRADTAVRDADIYQARLERLGEGYTRERQRAERAEAEAERLRTYRDATCICQHTEQQHFEDACLVCDCGDYLVPEAAREVIARWRDAATEAAEPHRLALSDALGLGTGAPWDAIRERAAELHNGAGTPQPETQAAQLPCQCGHGEAYHDFKYGGPRCRLCPESGEWTWRHAFRSAAVTLPGKEA